MGKSLSLFPIFFCLTGISVWGLAGDWSAALYSALGLPTIATPSIHDPRTAKQVTLYAGTGYDDIYRKQIDRKTVLTLSNRYYHLQAKLPFRLGQVPNLITGEAGHEQYWFDNLRDQTTLISRRRVEHPNYAITWSAMPGNYLVGVGVQTDRYQTRDSVQVAAFPRSEDSRANQYFFDLLEPTFGRNLADSLVHRVLELALWGAVHFKAGYWFGMAVSYTDGVGTSTIKYINTGKKAALQGARRIDIPFKSQQRAVRLSLMPESRPCQELALTIQQNAGRFYLNNNPPSFIDFDSLGEGKLRRTLVVVSGLFQWQQWQLGASLGGAKYGLDVFLRTPVLGFEWGILPIAHAATVRLTRSTSFSQQISLGRQFHWRHLTLNIGILYTHVHYDFHIKGQADLEFGLTTTPLDYPYKYTLHLLEISTGAVWQIGDLSLQHNFCQLLPHGKRMDRSPIHLSVEKEGMKYVHRGGRQHLISLGYHF